MRRTQIYLTEEERKSLKLLSGLTGKKCSQLVREAVDLFIVQSKSSRCESALNRAAGMWKDRRDLPDFGALRRTWDRG